MYELTADNVLFANGLAQQRVFSSGTAVSLVRMLDSSETSVSEEWAKIQTTDDDGVWVAYVRMSDLEEQ